MTMQIKSIILLTAALAFAACSDDVTHGDKFTVGDADNAINLSIGVQSSPTALQSRAPLAGHYAMQENTAINLYVEGDWTRRGGTIKKKSIYSAQADTDADNINTISWKSGDRLYWDDFGTADPDNTDNRTKGLGILAVAIDGIEGTSIVNLGGLINWATFKVDCDLESNKGTFEVGGKKFLKQDILIANNLYDEANGTSPQKRYTFDEQKVLGTNPAEARLEFQHVLSKITFNIKAGEGFEGLGGAQAFWTTPTVTLLARNRTNGAENPWCFTNGSIKIKTAQAINDGTKSVVKLSDMNTDLSNVNEAAIIYPGSDFGGNNDVIAKINADGNIYYVTAEKIRAAIDALVAGNTSHEHYNKYETLPGYNYIFNITVNKTDVVVTATITDWKTVTADPVEPKIVVTADVGKEDDKTKKLTEFRFYRNDDGATEPGKYIVLADAENPATNDIADGSTEWKFYDKDADFSTAETKSLYWPDHSTHYFFRGVYPRTAEVTEGSGTSSYIVVENKPYKEDEFPSNLMIGKPELDAGTMCDNPDHTPVDMSTHGICARIGKINLNFRYMMSQVEVVLNTTSGADKVAIGENTVVEITNAHSSGVVSLGTRKVTVSGSTGNYTLDADAVETNEDKKKLQRRSAIVPQSLDGLKFKVTVTNDNDTKDVYYSSIKDILVESNTITKWESGYHYKYTLTLKKTGISVTATITDWIPASGSDNVWM